MLAVCSQQIKLNYDQQGFRPPADKRNARLTAGHFVIKSCRLNQRLLYFLFGVSPQFQQGLSNLTHEQDVF
jgi:hypothetical protein